MNASRPLLLHFCQSSSMEKKSCHPLGNWHACDQEQAGNALCNIDVCPVLLGGA
jgi:hypothetical protein